MPLGERNDPVQAFTTHRPDQSLAERIRLRRPHGRFQHLEMHRPERRVHGGRIDRIAIVNQKPTHHQR